MAEDYLEKDFSWDDENNVDNTPPPSGKHIFAHLKMHVARVTKSYVAGDFISIPGVVGGQFDDKDSDGNKMFKGWKPGGNNKLFVLVATREAQDGSSYQVIKQYANQRFDKNEKVHVWGEMVYPALMAIPEKQRNKLAGPGLYVEFDEAPTGRTYEDKDIMYWTNYNVFPDRDAMKTAEAEFFSQFSSDGTAANSTDHYPESWKGSVNDCLVAIGNEFNSKRDAAEVVKLFLVDTSNGELLKTPAGTPIDEKAILKECVDAIDVPVELKADLYKKIEDYTPF